MSHNQLDSVAFQAQTENFHVSIITLDNISDALTLFCMQGNLPPRENEKVQLMLMGARNRIVLMSEAHLDSESKYIAKPEGHPLLSKE